MRLGTSRLLAMAALLMAPLPESVIEYAPHPVSQNTPDLTPEQIKADAKRRRKAAKRQHEPSHVDS